MRLFFFTGVIFGILAGQPGFALAEEVTQPSTPSKTSASPAALGASKKKPAKKTSKGRAGEKEAEGSQAANVFETDPVIKSKYQHNGESLEVDPD